MLAEEGCEKISIPPVQKVSIALARKLRCSSDLSLEESTLSASTHLVQHLKQTLEPLACAASVCSLEIQFNSTFFKGPIHNKVISTHSPHSQKNRNYPRAKLHTEYGKTSL